MTKKLFDFHAQRLGYNVRARETEPILLPNNDVLPREDPVQQSLF